MVGAQLFSAPLILFKSHEASPEDIEAVEAKNVALEAGALDPRLHLMTLMPWEGENAGSKYYLVRIEHLFQGGEHSSE